MVKIYKFLMVSWLVTIVLVLFSTPFIIGQNKQVEPIVAPIAKPDVDVDKAKDLQIFALTNRVARSEYNAQLDKFNAVPEIKALLDEMNSSAKQYNDLRQSVLTSAGIAEADWPKYDIDVTKKKIMLLPPPPEVKAKP